MMSVAMIFGAMLEPHMPDRSKSEIRDQEGHGGIRRARSLEVLFRDSSDVTVQANQYRHNAGRGPHLFKKRLSWREQYGRGEEMA